MKTHNHVFALVDCNNFYVSCERVFKPALHNKPVIVLSNNDGNVISRSAEAKALGIPMGAPYFKWKTFCQHHKVAVFSSNYELYGDMSHRVMEILKKHTPQMEVYSIDEAFLCFDGFIQENLSVIATTIREEVLRSTGIPVSIGLSHTKTLAKIANHLAKNYCTGVYNLCNTSLQHKELKNFPIEKIWGIGDGLVERLIKLNIKTAADLQQADPKFIRSHSNVTTEKIVQELNGISCIPLEKVPPRKQIIVSRSFGKSMTDLENLEEALSHYAATACKKLRKQNSKAALVYVFIETNSFNKSDAQYNACVGFNFPQHTDETQNIIRVSKKCLKHIYKQEFRYHKVGIVLTNLKDNTIEQYDMLNPTKAKGNQLMQSLDAINHKFGKDAIFHAAEGIKREWQMQRNMLSQRYTTKWDELPIVDCN